MIGEKFNSWTALSCERKIEGRKAKTVLCECECGARMEIAPYALKNNKTRSCRKCMWKRTKRKGASRHELYDTYRKIIARCYDKRDKAYYKYGGRGIGVCSRWLDDFYAFVEDMGPKRKGLTIDRIDNDLGYSKENCRWATPSEQNRNRRQDSRNTSGFRGVYKPKSSKKWTAFGFKDGKKVHLGCFLNKDDAIAARIKFEKENNWKGN